MSSAEDCAVHDGVPSTASYPSFEYLKQSGMEVKSTPEILRLHTNWVLRPHWEESIFVKDDDTWLGPVSPYYNRDTGALHEIAGMSISEPKVSSISVSQYEMGHVEEEFHIMHDDCNRAVEDPRDPNPAWMEFVIPPGYDWDDEDSPPLKKLRCCGVPCPVNRHISVTVRAHPSGPGYVTIHDYITTVHPWLIDLGQDLLTAYKLFNPPDFPAQTPRLEDLWVISPFLFKVKLIERMRFKRPIHNGLGFGQSN